LFLCIPISLLFCKFNIGEQDELLSILHLYIILVLSILFNNP